MSLRRALIVSGVLGLLGGGCNATNPAPQAHRAPSTPFATTRFTTTVPAGWSDDSGDQALAERLGISDSLLMLIDAPPPGAVQSGVNDLTANIIVTVVTQPVADGQLPQYLQSVKAAGAMDLSSTQTFMLDGVAGVYITYDRVISGTPAMTQDMTVNQAGSTFDIQFNASRWAFPAQVSALHEILDSWMWITPD
jgi:hypothetical protein